MTISINNLPNEVLEMILNLLPPYRDLGNCQLVCSRWAALVRNVRCRRSTFFQEAIIEGGLCWQRWNPEEVVTPPGRSGHAVAEYKGKMYVFGGEFRVGRLKRISLNDLWTFDLSTRTWAECCSAGQQPSTKFQATMVSHEDKLIVFGGYESTPLILTDELHVYDLREKKWIQPEITTPWPSAMFGHTATVHGREMVIFGGYHKTELSCSSDIWTLNLDTFSWEKKEELSREVKPSARMNHYQIRLDDENLLIVGGHKNIDLTDMWLLTMKSPQWSWREIPVRQECNGMSRLFSSNPACEVGKRLIILGTNQPDTYTEALKTGDFDGFHSCSVFNQMFICDLSHVLDTDPFAEWLDPQEVKVGPGVEFEKIRENYGSSLVAGNGELIHFGGQLIRLDRQATNNLHFIKPR